MKNRGKIPSADIDSINRKQIEKKLEALKAERLEFVQSANQQIAAYNGAIQMLEGLLAPAKPDQPPAAVEQKAEK